MVSIATGTYMKHPSGPQRQYTSLGDLAERASRFTGRKLEWQIRGGVFRLGDRTGLGNLALALDPRFGGLREVYRRTAQFGLTVDDLDLIKAEIDLGLDGSSTDHAGSTIYSF